MFHPTRSGSRGNFSCLIHPADSEEPVFIACPSDLQTSTMENGSFVSLPLAMLNATDNSGGVTVTNDYAGVPLALGSITLVTFTAVDPSGNFGLCSFNVTVAGK